MSNCTFEDGKKCRILTYKSCAECKFRKTAEEVEEAHRKAAIRLNSLPLNVRDEIREKYGGASFRYAKDES